MSRVKAWDQTGLCVLLALEGSSGKIGISWDVKINENKFPKSEGTEPCCEPGGQILKDEQEG